MISKIYGSSANPSFIHDTKKSKPSFGHAVEWINNPSKGWIHKSLYTETETQLLSFLNTLTKDGKIEFLPNDKLFSLKKLFKTSSPYNGILLLKTFARPYKLEYLTHDGTIFAFIREEKGQTADLYNSLISDLQKISQQSGIGIKLKKLFRFNLFKKKNYLNFFGNIF